MEAHWLTTIDNPFNPFVDFDRWYEYDTAHGYGTLELLGRLCNVSSYLIDNDYENEVETAINDFLVANPFGIYIRVTKDSVIKPISMQTLYQNQHFLDEFVE